MLNDLIKSGYQSEPLFATIHGVESAGKSSFAAGAPAPLFLDFEQGSNFLPVDRIHPESYKHCTEIIKMLEAETHQYQTLVIDSIDFAEVLMGDFVSKAHGKKTLEDFGFGSGYKHLAKEFISFLTKLERLRKNRRMNIIIIAHSLIKKYDDPRLQQGYDRYTIKLYHANAERLKESCDFLLFATFMDMTTGGADGQRAKGLSTGKRMLMTERTPAYDAKSRVALAAELEMSWAAFYNAVYPPVAPIQPQQQFPQSA